MWHWSNMLDSWAAILSNSVGRKATDEFSGVCSTVLWYCIIRKDKKTKHLVNSMWMLLALSTLAAAYPSEHVLPPPDNHVAKLLAHPPGNYPAKPHPQHYVSYKTTTAINIDGKLDDAPWQDAPFTDAFQDITANSSLKPWYETRVKMLWDDQYLYVGANLQDPKPFATLKEHDSIVFKDNDFEIFLNPSGSHWSYMEWEFNAYGTVWDLMLVKPYRDGGPPLMSWETVAPGEPTQSTGVTGWGPIQRAVHIDGQLNNGTSPSNGWSIEIAIPWSIICQIAGTSCPPTDGTQYRINFSRVQWNVTWRDRAYHKDPPDQSENNWVWSPQWIVNMHYPEFWGYLQFSEKAPGSEVVDFKPDPLWALKTFLMDVYYAQQVYKGKHGVYSRSLHALGLEAPTEALECGFRIEVTRVGFLASLVRDGMLLHVNEQSRMLLEPVGVAQTVVR